MAACFSSANTFAAPFVYVLSQIPKLAEFLKSSVLPGIQIKALKISGDCKTNQILDKEELSSIREAEIIVCDPSLLAKIYKDMPHLKWAHCTWAGVEPLLKAIPAEPQFLVTRHGGEAFSALMAEYVVCQILNSERRFKLCWKAQEKKSWLSQEEFFNFRTLDELTVGILGIGNMASGIAKFLKTRGTTVLGFARRLHSQYDRNLFDRVFNTLDDVLLECDYICNTLPSTPLTCGMLNNSLLKKCVKKPVFINVGRGNIISENELVSALSNGWLSGAVLDVFEEEPLPTSSELWNMPQVIITPHIAAPSKPEHVADEFFRIFAQYIDGHEIPNVVNWEAGY